MVWPILPSINVNKPFNWVRGETKIRCQNLQCSYIDFGPNKTPLESYSPGEDNGDGTVRLNNAGYCLNCLADIIQE